MEKELGKITKAEFGTYPDRPFLMGLQLEFSMNGSRVGCGGKYTVNISPNCKWDSDEDRGRTLVGLLEDLDLLLRDAKVDHVSQLKNMPVEIQFENNFFKSFRILHEVL